jgi:hypothetical protein
MTGPGGLTPRAIVIVASLADLRTIRGPAVTGYVFVLALGVVYVWTANSSAIDNGTPTSTAVVSLTGGFMGAWLRQWTPDEAAAALTNADATIAVDGGLWLTLPAGTLLAPHTLTLSPTNAGAGAYIEVTRLDLSAYAFTVANGGGTGGDVCVMPGGARSHARAYFDGENFLHRSSGLML